MAAVTISLLMRRPIYLKAMLDAMHIGFALQDVQRVIRASAVRAVPAAGGCLMGTIAIAGEPVAIYDTRRLFGLPARPLRASDRFLLARTPRPCGFVVDAVLGTVEAESVALADSTTLRAAGLRGVARGPDGLLLVQRLDQLLALERAVPIARMHRSDALAH